MNNGFSSAVAPQAGGRLASCLLAFALLAPCVRADPVPAAQADWQDLVDGLQVRTTHAPPDAELEAVPSKAGEWCEVQFYAWELAADGVTRKKLLDGAAFGEPARVVVIGEGREPAALELGLIGLRPGEGRQVRAPARHWPGAAGQVLLDVQLLERKPGISVDRLQSPAAPGAVRAARGDAVVFKWALSRVDAKGGVIPVPLEGGEVSAVVGDGTLVRGLDLGLRGMAAGEARAVTVPAHLGYGDRGAGGDLVPPGSTLRFMVEMRRVEKKEGRP